MIVVLRRIGGVLLKTFNYYSVFYVVTSELLPVQLVVCRGSSMEPALHHNDLLFCEATSVRRQHIRKHGLGYTSLF